MYATLLSRRERDITGLPKGTRSRVSPASVCVPRHGMSTLNNYPPLTKEIIAAGQLNLARVFIYGLGGRVKNGECREDDWLPSGFAQSVARSDLEHWATSRQENVT